MSDSEKLVGFAPWETAVIVLMMTALGIVAVTFFMWFLEEIRGGMEVVERIDSIPVFSYLSLTEDNFRAQIKLEMARLTRNMSNTRKWLFSHDFKVTWEKFEKEWKFSKNLSHCPNCSSFLLANTSTCGEVKHAVETRQCPKCLEPLSLERCKFLRLCLDHHKGLLQLQDD